MTWLPIDTPGAVRRFLRHWRPLRGVLMETEVWPSLLAACAGAGVPVTLANARLSERSLRKGQGMKALLGGAAGAADAGAGADRGRRATPAPDGRGEGRGDGQPEVRQQPRARAAGAGSGLARRAGAAAGAAGRRDARGRGGPAAQPLPAGAGAKRPLLLLVPRHPQRFDEVAQRIEQAGLRLARRSSSWAEGLPPLDAEAWLGDGVSDAGLLRGGRSGPAGRQLCTAGGTEPDPGRGLWLLRC